MLINGNDYKLSPRKAKDVFVLKDACEGLNETELTGASIRAQVICDSLKATWRELVIPIFIENTDLAPKFISKNIDNIGCLYKRLGWIKRYKLKKLLKIYIYYLTTQEYLIESLSIQDIVKYSDEIMEIENGKKKVVVENQSAEMLQKEK